MDTYYQDIEEWRRSADQNLRKKNSWLALSGLFWLTDGENSFGTDPSNSIVLAHGSGAGKMGNFNLQGDQVTMHVEDDVAFKINGQIVKEATLKPDSSGEPTEIKLDHLTLRLIEREDGLGIRLWDNLRLERKEFPGRVWFPIDQDYRVSGIYEPFDEVLDLVFQRKNGSDFQDQVQGQINFQLQGQEYSLLAFEQEDGSLFTLFLDQTTGKECYPAGRYLVIDPPRKGSIEIDFNRAYNPPCAFTDFATCPLPPARNRLPVPILAGERI